MSYSYDILPGQQTPYLYHVISSPRLQYGSLIESTPATWPCTPSTNLFPCALRHVPNNHRRFLVSTSYSFVHVLVVLYLLYVPPKTSNRPPWRHCLGTETQTQETITVRAGSIPFGIDQFNSAPIPELELKDFEQKESGQASMIFCGPGRVQA